MEKGEIAMRCSNCTDPLPRGACFCPNCGAQVKRMDSELQPDQAHHSSGHGVVFRTRILGASRNYFNRHKKEPVVPWVLAWFILSTNVYVPKPELLYAMAESTTASTEYSQEEVRLVQDSGLRQEKDGDLGSARYLQDDVVLVSIYVDYQDVSWDEGKEEDARNSLAVACEYLEAEAGRYGQELNIFYDVEKEDGLLYRMDYELSAAAYKQDDIIDAPNFDMYLWKWIDDNIPVADIQKAYGTDNIGFLAMVADVGTSYANVFYMEDPDIYYNEVSVLYFYYPYTRTTDQEVPAVYAHEILHLFGAIDLYEGSEAFSPENMDYVAEHYPSDIMYSVYCDSNRLHYEEIHLEIGPVTAYYLGWLDELPEEDQENLTNYKRAVVAGFSYGDPWFNKEDWGEENEMNKG